MRVALLGGCVLVASTQALAQVTPPSPGRDMGGGRCSGNAYNCADVPNPLPSPNTVWLEEMTWMDVRDAMKAGKTTIIISTGGIEPNGPWLALGKHNYVLRANCDAIARKLGNAICAPIVPFVPEGGIDPKTGHIEYANAGHVPPLLISNCGVTQMNMTDMVVGLFASAKYRNQTMQLAQGDSLVLFTDGVTEAENESEDQLGLAPVAAMVEKLHGNCAAEILTAIDTHVQTFCGNAPSTDDVTMMALTRL